MRTQTPRLEPERRELGWRQGDARDGVDPALYERLPGPFDLQSRDTGLPKEVRERVEPLASHLAGPKPAAQRREGDPLLGVDGIDRGLNPDDVQEPRGRAGH